MRRWKIDDYCQRAVIPLERCLVSILYHTKSGGDIFLSNIRRLWEYLQPDGQRQPLGLMVYSANVYPSSRDPPRTETSFAIIRIEPLQDMRQ